MRARGNFQTVRWGIKGGVPTLVRDRRAAVAQDLSTITKARCRTLSTYAWGDRCPIDRGRTASGVRTVSLARHGHVWGRHV